ncbi:hypothetical protein N7490_010344 [Penicillium lividum]|nr:hypothetical protein N7490_010344 [Penicillium lividum]
MGLPIYGPETVNDPKPSEEPSPTPELSQKPREKPGAFTQFLLMVMGFEVVLQHRTMGEMGMNGKIR